MLTLVLLLLLTSVTAHAGPKMWDDETLTPGQLLTVSAALKPFSEASHYAEDSLPPCEGLDYLSNAAFQHEAPKQCPIAREGYEQIQRFDRHARESCRELSEWAEKNLRNEALATSAALRLQAKNELRAMKRAGLGDFDAPLPPNAPTNYGPDFAENFGVKESDDIRCYVTIAIVMSFRKHFFELAQENFSRAEQALDEIQDHPGAEPYFQYLRYGNTPKH